MTPSLPWRRDRHGLAPLLDPPKVADLPEPRLSSGARYLGTELAGDGGAPQRVADHGLGGAGSCRLNLSAEALDVIRLAGAFRIPVAAVRGATGHRGVTAGSPEARRFAVRWEHGDHRLTTRFELTPVKPVPGQSRRGPDRGAQPWVRALSKIAKENA